MPGIFGFVCKKERPQPFVDALLRGMAGALCHSDEYELETHTGSWFAVGHCGLPFRGEKHIQEDTERGLVVAYSGFVYEFTDSGSQAVAGGNNLQRLVEQVEKHGPSAADTIHGSFNLFGIDLHKRTAFIANCKLGHRQLYYHEDPDIFMFSSEMKAFLAYPGFERDVDRQAVADYFNYTFVLGEKTFFRSVKTLRGGTLLRLANGHLTTESYWSMRYNEREDFDTETVLDEFDALFKRLLRQKVRGAEHAVIPLSGGLDSRFIAAQCRQIGIDPFLFTHGIKGCADHRIARQVARRLGFRRYRFVQIDPMWLPAYARRFVFLTDGMIHLGPCMLLGVSDQYGLPRKTTAFLNGINSTNLYTSYFNPNDVGVSLTYNQKLQNLRLSLFGQIYTSGYYSFFSPDWRDYIRKRYMESIDEEFSRYLEVSPHFCDQKDAFFICNRQRRFMNQVDCNRYLWHDHFAMADPSLLLLYLGLPARMRVSRSLFMEYYRTRLPEMATIPYQKTGVNLFQKPSARAKSIRTTLKKAKYYAERISLGALKLYDRDNYYHFNQWYRTYRPIRRYFEDLLTDPATLNRGYYNRRGVDKLLTRQRHGGNSFFDISSLAAFEIFHRVFIDP